MKVNDLSKKITSQVLNEGLAKNFGMKLKINEFSDTQLEDVRNKLRTELSQFEMNEGFNSSLDNTHYQKTKAFLEVVNQEIFEREQQSNESIDRKTKIKKKRSTMRRKQDNTEMLKNMKNSHGTKKGKEIYYSIIRKRAMEHSVPDSWIKGALRRIHLGESTNMELQAELKTRYDLNESQSNYILNESEELKAEVILATTDMIDKLTSWIDDVANMKSEQLLELLDTIRENYSPQIAEQYNNVVKQTLETCYNAMESTRGELNKGLDIVVGRHVETMGGDNLPMPTSPEGNNMSNLSPEQTPELPSMDVKPPEKNTLDDRIKRESVEYSRKLGLMFQQQKKKL